MSLGKRKYTLGKEFYTSDKDQFSRFKRLDKEEQEAVEIALEEFDKDIALFASENEKKPTGNDDGSVEWVVNQEGRVIVKFYYNTGKEIFHISSFIRDGRIGGIHIAWPCPKDKIFHDCHEMYSNARNRKRYIYLTNEWIMEWLGEGHKINGGVDLLNTILDPLITYFETGRRVSDGIEISGNIAEFIKSCKNYHWDKDRPKEDPLDTGKKIVNLLKKVHEETKKYTTWATRGGSTKTVMYLVKIDKLKQKNKLLKKDKIKNKNKIEKNNKLINELKAKAKKEKAKAKAKAKKEKAKAKKEKAKAKAKKVTCKKSTCSKKNKK